VKNLSRNYAIKNVSNGICCSEADFSLSLPGLATPTPRKGKKQNHQRRPSARSIEAATTEIVRLFEPLLDNYGSAGVRVNGESK
jgi:hypothetical protein